MMEIDGSSVCFFITYMAESQSREAAILAKGKKCLNEAVSKSQKGHGASLNKSVLNVKSIGPVDCCLTVGV